MKYFVDYRGMEDYNDFNNLTQEDHEDISLSFLVRFKEAYRERIKSGIINGDDESGVSADMVEKLICSYFDYRRSYVPISQPFPHFTYDELLDFLNNEVLDFIAEEKPEYVFCDSEGEYYLIESEYDDD